ncbi:MAG: hypothetical protein WA081_20965 [Desulfosalsimonadaceae bacterium]
MRLIKKVVPVSGIFLCFIVIILSGTGIYFYYHPERVKPVIERSLAAATGYSCAIENLSWSFQPMVLEAGGIIFESPKPNQAFRMEIPFLRTDMTIQGQWGRKSLVFENIKITGIFMNSTSPAILPVRTKPSFPARMVQGIAGFFFFKDIRFQSGEILDGHISATWGNQTIRADKIHAKADTGKPLFLSFALEIQNAAHKMHVSAPNVTLVSGNVFNINDFKFSGTLQAKGVKIQDTELGTQARDILIGDIGLHIPDGHIDTEKRSISFPNVRFDIFGLKNLLLAIDLKDGTINLVLQGKNTAILHEAAAREIVPPGWDLSAKDAIRISAQGPEAGPWQVRANLSLEDLAFKNKDGSLMGEKISLVTETKGVVDLAHSSMTFAVALEAGAGEALYDRYYVNLAKNPVVSSCKGTYEFQTKFLNLSMLKFDLTDILPIEIQGSLKQGSSIQDAGPNYGRDADFSVKIPQTPLKPIVYHLLQEPYKTEKPFLAALETGGTVSAEFKINEKENVWQVKGRIGWRKGNIILKDPDIKDRNIKDISVKGIILDLPVWYQTGLAPIPAEGLKGKLEIQSVTLPPLPDQPLNILLDAGPNRISVDSPTRIQVPGGTLSIGSMQVKNLFSPDISVHTRLACEAINLQALLSGIGAFPPEGTPAGVLTGILDPVRYGKHAITSQGEITAEAFGGTIFLSDLGASGLFTSAPVFKLNAHWDDLMLTQMTTDTTFGKIEGVLKGHVRNFEIANGQPQKFELLLETVEKKGFPQTISIKAVDNIAQIGGGQSPFMGLAGSFASVFKKFPYEKIGIRSSLENDMFTIKGTIREDGTEYLVKRRGFSGVNIVNQNPDNRIRFMDMLKRIKRITHKGGAVVN